MTHNPTQEEILDAAEDDLAEPEVVNAGSSVVRRPGDIPSTLEELAALGKVDGQEILTARVAILRTLRTASLLATSPSDWLLFRTREGRVTGYLQDSGCQRVRPLWGIEITPTGDYSKIQASNDFAYSITGDGYCSVTRQRVIGVEGLRYSTDDFCRDLTPIMKEMRVRQAARANLDGNVTRKLTGLSVVPVEEIAAAWEGTSKNVDSCNRGRGFGSRYEREGAEVQHGDAPPPVSDQGGSAAPAEPACPICGGKMYYREAGTTKVGKPYPAFWSCSKYKQGCRGSLNHSAWLEQINREPGQEG